MRRRECLILVGILLAAGCTGDGAGVGDGALDTASPTPTSLESPESDLNTVRVVASYPDENGNKTNVTVLTTQENDFEEVGSVSEFGDTYGLPVTLTKSGAQEFAEILKRTDFTSDGRNACSIYNRGYCLLMFYSDDVVYGASLAVGLAQDIISGDFLEHRNLVLSAHNESTAKKMKKAIQKSQ